MGEGGGEGMECRGEGAGSVLEEVVVEAVFSLL